VSVPIGIARATKGNVTPAGEKFCEILGKDFGWSDCGQTKSWEGLLKPAERVMPGR
jgi:hypothetical protein